MSSVRPKTEHFLAGQTREIPRRKQKKKKPLGSAFDFVPHVSSVSQHVDVSYFTLFMVKRNS